jgi:MoaA/NifB/PqqE/SkfB family radical SAM enzyme
MHNDLWCPLAANSATIKTNGLITTCCIGKTVIDTESSTPFSANSHTLKEAFESKEFQSIRNNLSNGIKDNNCSDCWTIEESGGESPRLSEIRWVSQNYKREDKLRVVDLALGNQCNLKCRMCRPQDSSFWIKEFYDLDLNDKISFNQFQKNKIFKVEPDSRLIESLKVDTLPEIEEMSFYGGEPFMMKSVWSLLHYAVDNGYSKNIKLSFNTNCTFWDEENIELLQHFKEVVIAMSVDGIEERFEYMRHPAKWADAYSNIKKIIQWKKESETTRTLILNFTFSLYNVFYIKEVIKLAEEHDILFFANSVIFPEILSVNNMPDDLKKKTVEELSTGSYTEQSMQELKKVMDFINLPGNTEIWSQFLQEYKKRDSYREESFEKTFPEYFELINKNNTDS